MLLEGNDIKDEYSIHNNAYHHSKRNHFYPSFTFLKTDIKKDMYKEKNLKPHFTEKRAEYLHFGQK